MKNQNLNLKYLTYEFISNLTTGKLATHFYSLKLSKEKVKEQ